LSTSVPLVEKNGVYEIIQCVFLVRYEIWSSFWEPGCH